MLHPLRIVPLALALAFAAAPAAADEKPQPGLNATEGGADGAIDAEFEVKA